MLDAMSIRLYHVSETLRTCCNFNAAARAGRVSFKEVFKGLRNKQEGIKSNHNVRQGLKSINTTRKVFEIKKKVVWTYDNKFPVHHQK
jgi:hypothetical protein